MDDNLTGMSVLLGTRSSVASTELVAERMCSPGSMRWLMVPNSIESRHGVFRTYEYSYIYYGLLEALRWTLARVSGFRSRGMVGAEMVG